MNKTLKEDKLFSEKIRKLSESTLLGSLSTLINSTITVVVLWPVVSHKRLLLWFGFLIFISIPRLYLQKTYQKYEGSPTLLNKWKKYFLITIGISGLIWGMSAIYLFPENSIPHQSFIAFVLGGMAAGSVGVFSAMRRAFLTFSIPAVLPLTLRFFLIHDPIHFAMGLMLSLFWFILFMTARRLHQDILNSILLKYENIDLIDELEKEVDIRKAAEEDLKKQKQEVEKVVDLRTTELLETNQQLTREIADRELVTIKLRDSEEKYRDLVENINDIIYSVDMDGIMTYVSPVVEFILGFTQSDIMGKPFNEFIHPEDLSFVMARFQQLRSRQLEESEYRLLTKSGDYRWIRSSSKPFQQDGHIIGIRGVLIDISERKQFEIERDNLETQLKQAQKMESIGTLAGGIAHDFNNILHMIIGNAELMLEDLPDRDSLRDKIADIKTASLRASGIVKQLLDFSRNANQEQTPMGAVAVIKDAIKFLRSTIPSFITINKHLPEREITILGNPVQIHQVLMNIFTNASQAMEETGGEINITVDQAFLSKSFADEYLNLTQGDYLKIEISDNGPGIDPKSIDRIFEPYFTTKPFGQGSGMGLAVVHGIVKNHEGIINVASKPGNGTAFTIFLPIFHGANSEKQESTDEIPKGNETILFIDDEQSITKMAKQLLGKLGYHVVLFSNPIKALESFMLHPGNYDLVITDMTMPLMTGAKVAEKIKKFNSTVPIIISTGYSSLMDENKAKEMGIDAYILKPFVKKEIAVIIREVLDKGSDE